MKRGLRFFLIIALFFSISFVSAIVIEDSLHLNIQVTNSSNNNSILTGTFDFVFNISTTSTCSNIVYTNSTTLTTDPRGVISYYLENVNLDFNEQYWLCYYRDSILINASRIARVPYAFRAKNVTLSGVDIDTNLDLGNFNLTASIGNFGVGVPGYSLNVAGNVNVSENLSVGGYVGIGTTDPNGPLSFGNAVGNKILLWDNGGPTYYGFGIQSNLLQIFSSATAADIAFGWGNSSSFNEKMRIDSSTGYVGIGTATPAAPLDIRSNETTVSLILRGLSSAYQTKYPAILFYSGVGTGNGLLSGKVYNSFLTGGSWSDVAMRFQVPNSAGTLVDTLTLTNEKVGIGITNPELSLHVNSSSGGGIRLSSGTQKYGFISSVGNNHISQNVYYNGSNWVLIEDGNASLIQTALAVGEAFRVSSNTSSLTAGTRLSLTPLFVIKELGNVGIGTTTPSQKLEVVGNTNITGNLTIGSGTISYNGSTLIIQVS